MPIPKKDRCRFTWNPGRWPYVQRCGDTGIRPVPQINDEPDALFCDLHATTLERQVRREQEDNHADG